MDSNGSKNGSGFISYKFVCINCDYKCNKQSEYTKHLATQKHQRRQNDSKNLLNKKFRCECGKEYKYESGYYRHKKKCNYEENKIIKNDEDVSYKQMLIKMMNENDKLRNTITELIPKIGNTTNNNHNNISQKFNINVFLNEECKDALTMDQFIEKIEVTIGNLLLTKSKGIDEGISNIFIENMNKLSLYERPMHCTDTKRDTIYIKTDGCGGDEGQWEKDTDKEKIKKAIKKIECKQHKNLNKWMDEHPGWETHSNLQKEYLELMRSCTKDINKDKIIKRVCNNVKID